MLAGKVLLVGTKKSTSCWRKLGTGEAVDLNAAASHKLHDFNASAASQPHRAGKVWTAYLLHNQPANLAC